ncbi:hypothetical protein [Acinetobacter sp. NCu2D-2]|uniref:hypothetical protein n=1 Tax=Acinetobacter sp. NCu2D-2 TaxID=1608473 RepID=UPI000A6E650E|nr:hypothetical protein [Acinetobacter sp. NCu2D-2]
MKKSLFFFSTLVLSSNLYSAPNDLFLEVSPHSEKLNLSASLDLVNNTVDIFDIRESEGIKGDSGDYLGVHLIGQYHINPEWLIDTQYWHREIDYSIDTNKLDTVSLTLQFAPERMQTNETQIAFRLGAWGNYANEIQKSTPTLINGKRIENVTVVNPEDLQIQFDAVVSHKIDFMNRINFFGSVGYSKVKVEQLDAIGQFNGCNAKVKLKDNNQLIGEILGRCVIDGLIIKTLDFSNLSNSLPINIDQDLNYDAYYASLGGSWNWRYKQFESQLAYQYQRLWRDGIDDRISTFGNSPIKDNHTFGAKFSYDFTPKITGYLQGQLFQKNLIGYVPFLYNGVTASRLDKRYGLASIGIQYKAF